MNSFRKAQDSLRTRFLWYRTACPWVRPRRSAWTTSAPRRSTMHFQSPGALRWGENASEIADAFSVQRNAQGVPRIRVHIASPALGYAPGSSHDSIARERLSTAYMPGSKYTMLPEDVIERFSLDHSGERPAVSLYFDVSESDWTVKGRHTRLERVPVAANLRHARYDVLNDAFASGASAGLAFEDELRALWRLAGAL